MEFVTIEDRVDRLEALFGQFITEMAVLNKRAEERNKAAEERNKAAEERNKTAEERNKAAEERMTRFEQEMKDFKDEMREDRKRMNKQWGDLANKLGTIVEDILVPNVRRLATEYFGFPELLEILTRWHRKKPNTPSDWEEFDLVITGPEAVIVGEAKSSMNLQLAEQFAKKLKGFAEFAPHLAHLRVIPVLGCWSIPTAVINRLSELGIYAMCMGDETMEIVNGDAVARRTSPKPKK